MRKRYSNRNDHNERNLMKESTNDDYIRDISKLMKSISHPIRFKILCLLQDEEVSVGGLVARLDSSNSNISQHLNILRNQGIIDYRKDANYIYNRITDWRIIELIRKVHQLYFFNHPTSASIFLDRSFSRRSADQEITTPKI